MQRITTPVAEEHEAPRDSPTTTRAKIRGTVEFCDAKKIPYFKTDVFRFFGVSHNRGYEYLRNGSSNLISDNPDKEETRGRKRIVSPQLIREMERLLEAESRVYTWEELGKEVGLECSSRTVQRAMGTMDFHRCISCRRGWCNSKIAQQRMEWAGVMLQRYPQPQDWSQVRFSDEIHFGWDSQVGKIQIIQKPGLRVCLDCIQGGVEEPEEKDKNRHHCWTAAGHNFKTDMIFYDVPGHGNGKMSQKMYIEQILEPIVKPWMQMGQDFVLEEDGEAGGYGGGKSSIVRSWKHKHGLNYYFNCPSSPDLSPIENIWQPPPIRKYPHWDDVTTKQLIYEGWSHVSQRLINETVITMPERLQAVIIGGGRMTGY